MQTSNAYSVDAADGWVEISSTFEVTTSEAYTVRYYTDKDNATIYFDDASWIELDQVSPSTSTPSSSANSFNTGKWSDADGAILVDGLDSNADAKTADINTTTGTVALWSYINKPYDTGEDAYLFDVRGADNNNRISLYYSATNDQFTVYINGAARITVSAETDNTRFRTWLHCAITYDFTADSYILYLDGVSVGSDSTALASPAFGSNSIYIGSDYLGANQSDAFIDDFRLYGEVLTATEIANLVATDIE